MKTALTFEQCTHHAKHLKERVEEVLNTPIDVFMNEEGDISVKVYDERKQGAIVEFLINFWGLRRLSRPKNEPILMFFELKEKNQ